MMVIVLNGLLINQVILAGVFPLWSISPEMTSEPKIEGVDETQKAIGYVAPVPWPGLVSARNEIPVISDTLLMLFPFSSTGVPE